MKKTGSIRVEIKDEDGAHYWIDHPKLFRGYAFFGIDKAAVTEIREEVEWYKVEYNTPVAVWDHGGVVRMGFYRGKSGDGGYCVSWTDGGATDVRRKHIMLLTDWLKKHGEGGE